MTKDGSIQLNSPLVSIVLWVWNHQEQARESIQACLNQTYKNIELIVVDDGVNMPPEFFRDGSDSRARIIRHNAPIGLARSLNEGFRNSQGTFLGFLKENCILEPSAIERMMETLSEDRNSGFVYCDYKSWIEETNEEIIHKYNPNSKKQFRYTNLSPFYIYSRELAEKIGLFDERYELMCGFDFFVRAYRALCVLNCPEILARVIEGNDLISRRRRVYSAFYRHVNLYHARYITLKEFERALEEHPVRISKLVKGKIAVFMTVWRDSLKMYHFSFIFGVMVELLICRILFRQMFYRIFNPILECLQRLNKAIIELSLRKAPNKINVLCLLPQVLIGGSEKVLWDLVDNADSNRLAFHLLSRKREKNSWCRRMLKSFNQVLLLKERSNYEDECWDEEIHEYLSIMLRALDIKIIVTTNVYALYRLAEKIKTEFPHVKIVDILHVEKFGGVMEEFFPAIPYLDERVCISEGLRRYLKEKYERAGVDPVFSKALSVVYNGNNMRMFTRQKQLEGLFKKRYKISPTTKLISFIGRMSSEKRPELFVEIARDVVQKRPKENIKFVMAGDGHDLKSVRKLIDEYGLSKNILLTGGLSYSAVQELMHDTHIVMLVSESEGVPLVMVEALSMEVPVISTDVGSIDEVIVPEMNGILISPKGRLVSEFASSLLRVIDDDMLYNKLAKNARQSVMEKFSMEVMTQGYQQVFDRVFQQDPCMIVEPRFKKFDSLVPRKISSSFSEFKR